MRAKSFTLFACLMVVALLCAACELKKPEVDFGPGVHQVSPQDVLGLQGPIWSPDSSTLAVTYGNNTEGLRIGKIYTLNVETGGLDLLAETETGTRRAQSWSRRGNEIAFYADGDGIKTGIWAMTADGTGEKRFISSGTHATWAPVGAQTAITESHYDHTTQVTTVTISLLDPSSRDLRVVFTRSGKDQVGGDLAFSPDGTRLAFGFGAGPGLTMDVYVLDLGTGKLDQLTHGGYNTSPTWSADGSMIAYVEAGSRDQALVITRADGTCRIWPLRVTGFVTSSAWSPDGSKIAFAYDNRVYIMDVATVLGADFSEKGPECP
jgi:TolB protein